MLNASHRKGAYNAIYAVPSLENKNGQVKKEVVKKGRESKTETEPSLKKQKIEKRSEI